MFFRYEGFDCVMKMIYSEPDEKGGERRFMGYQVVARSSFLQEPLLSRVCSQPVDCRKEIKERIRRIHAAVESVRQSVVPDPPGSA